MKEKPPRKCRLCGMPLSMYNRGDVCFCHSEHPDFSEKVIEHLAAMKQHSACPGHNVPGLNKIKIQEYGPDFKSW